MAQGSRLTPRDPAADRLRTATLSKRARDCIPARRLSDLVEPTGGWRQGNCRA